MKRKKTTKILLLTFLLLLPLLALGSLVFAQDIEFTLNLRQKEFRVAEPVVVEFKMVNRAGKEIQFHKPDLASQTLRVWIQKKEGSNEQYKLNYITENIPLLTLAPGETFQTEETIFFNYNKDVLAFPQEGEYTLKAEYLGYMSVTLPPPAEIIIKIIPNASGDKKWEEFFSQKATIDFLNLFSKDPAILQHLKDLIKKYPQSLFAFYGQFYLAHQEAAEFSGKSPNFEKAVEWMKKADVKGFQLEREALFYLARWSWELGNAEEALRYLDRLSQEFPNTLIAENAAALKQRWSVRKPSPPPKKIVPVEGKTKKEIEKTLKAYFESFAKADLEGCLAKLDENFMYNEALNKEAMAEEFKEDFAKFKDKGTLKVNWELKKIEMVEGIPTAQTAVSYSFMEFPSDKQNSISPNSVEKSVGRLGVGKEKLNNDQPFHSPSLIQIEFIQKAKQWVLKSIKSL